jgi:NADH pyrophosphatase NudC (nudix superfamily)
LSTTNELSTNGYYLNVNKKFWITGFLEKGETPENGVLREVTEELGLTGSSAELIGVYAV